MKRFSKNEYDEILEILYRIKSIENFNVPKHKFIKAKIDENLEDFRFPIHQILFIPRETLELILQHINNIDKIHLKFDFEEQTIKNFILNYYSKNYFEDIFKYRDETINLWHIFNKNKYWSCNEQISAAEQCIQRMMEKWENEIYDYKEEIQFIKDKFDQFIEKKGEEFIKKIPFELYHEIIQQLPEEKKIKWMKNIVIEEREDLIKLRLIEMMGDLDIDNLSESEFHDVLEIIQINLKKSEMNWIEKILKRLHHPNQNQEKERLEKQKNEEEEGRKQMELLPVELSKEQQFFKSNEKGYIYAIKKFLKDGVKIDAEDSHFFKRRRYNNGQH